MNSFKNVYKADFKMSTRQQPTEVLFLVFVRKRFCFENMHNSYWFNIVIQYYSATIYLREHQLYKYGRNKSFSIITSSFIF